MIGRLSTDTQPIFHSINIHTDFLLFILIGENFACWSRWMAWNWIVYADYFEGFSLSPGSDVRKMFEGIGIEGGRDFDLATTM